MNDDPADTLHLLWNAGAPEVRAEDLAAIDGETITAIDFIINDAKTFLAFRYILPGQLLAKLNDPSRHTLALQAGSPLPGSFDARSFCKQYVCAFDRENHRVLGGSDDPLVGNIGRRPEMDAAWLRVGRRAEQGGRQLVDVLTRAQEHPESVEALLRLTLRSIAARLARTRIVYPRPNRVSLPACEALVADFLSTRTGGRRLQAAAAALFDTIGMRFTLFSHVEAGHVNKADASRGDVADLDCRNAEGQTVLSVEVKDRQLSVREVEDTLRIARDRGVAEILYVIRGGVSPDEKSDLERLQSRHFAAGHNVYHIEFESLLRPCLMLFGETGRLLLLENVSQRIDAMADLTDRQAWQKLLESL